MLQMENVKPAGVNRLGYKSEIAPVLMPFIGRVTASVFTVITTTKANRFKKVSDVVFIPFKLGVMIAKTKPLAKEIVVRRLSFLYFG